MGVFRGVPVHIKFCTQTHDQNELSLSIRQPAHLQVPPGTKSVCMMDNTCPGKRPRETLSVRPCAHHSGLDIHKTESREQSCLFSSQQDLSTRCGQGDYRQENAKLRGGNSAWVVTNVRITSALCTAAASGSTIQRCPFFAIDGPTSFAFTTPVVVTHVHINCCKSTCFNWFLSTTVVILHACMCVPSISRSPSSNFSHSFHQVEARHRQHDDACIHQTN